MKHCLSCLIYYMYFLITISKYRFYGEPVVKAAVENGCHHLDISGEPEVRLVKCIILHSKYFFFNDYCPQLTLYL